MELLERTPGNAQLIVLRKADHQHFIDDIEERHDAVRTTKLTGDAAWIPSAMLPVSDLCSADQAHLFVRGLTLAHFDAHLHGLLDASAWLGGDVEAALAGRSMPGFVCRAG